MTGLFARHRFALAAVGAMLGLVFLFALFWQVLLQLAALLLAARLLWLVAFGRSRRQGRVLELLLKLVETVSLALIARNMRPVKRSRPKLLAPLDMCRQPRRRIQGPGELPEGF